GMEHGGHREFVTVLSGGMQSAEFDWIMAYAPAPSPTHNTIQGPAFNPQDLTADYVKRATEDPEYFVLSDIAQIKHVSAACGGMIDSRIEFTDEGHFAAIVCTDCGTEVGRIRLAEFASLFAAFDSIAGSVPEVHGVTS